MLTQYGMVNESLSAMTEGGDLRLYLDSSKLKIGKFHFLNVCFAFLHCIICSFLSKLKTILLMTNALTTRKEKAEDLICVNN
jgi:hypothetical protein